MLIQGRTYCCRFDMSNLTSHHDDQVARRQAVLSLAETLAKQSLERVSPSCPGHLFTRNGKPDAWVLSFFPSYQDRYKGVGTAEIMLEYLLKFDGTGQSQPSRERLPGTRSHFKASGALYPSHGAL